jgi:hypothetical protein
VQPAMSIRNNAHTETGIFIAKFFYTAKIVQKLEPTKAMYGSNKLKRMLTSCHRGCFSAKKKKKSRTIIYICIRHACCLTTNPATGFYHRQQQT